jgi:hypothetical protein
LKNGEEHAVRLSWRLDLQYGAKATAHLLESGSHRLFFIKERKLVKKKEERD